ncbi:hypothetical protein ACERC8_01490 [Streptococcus sp. E29BA]|uniref:hypothetical protein n=1 Tax=Streptococcus sp. E29BA TaxID=3278716 RepID=UPI00359F131F
MVQQELFERDLEKVGMYGQKSLEVDGFKALIRRTPMGHLCGYVEVPEDLSVDTNYIDCHGGVTADQSDVESFPTTGRYIGFDCAHAGDWTPWHQEGFYRNYEFVVGEIEGIVRQLKNLEEVTK